MNLLVIHPHVRMKSKATKIIPKCYAPSVVSECNWIPRRYLCWAMQAVFEFSNIAIGIEQLMSTVSESTDV